MFEQNVKSTIIDKSGLVFHTEYKNIKEMFSVIDIIADYLRSVFGKHYRPCLVLHDVK